MIKAPAPHARFDLTRSRLLDGVIQFHHVAHVLLRCLPNYADVASCMIHRRRV